MRRLMVFLISLLFYIHTLKGQGTITLEDKPFVYNSAIDSSLWNLLYENEFFRRLPENEQLFFYWTNKFRKSPTIFYNEVVKEFVRQFPEANKAEIKSLERDVLNIKMPLQYLVPDEALNNISKRHAVDLSKNGGRLSHTSSNGITFAQRIKESGSFRCAGENLFLGSPDPLEVLITLLIDYGVPDKGHRKNLMDASFSLMGASFAQFLPKKVIVVQTFGCR